MFVCSRGSIVHAAAQPHLGPRASYKLTPFLQLCKTAYGLKNSLTVSMPQWRELCKAHQLKDKNMPTDIRTHWNSTYIMLEFAIEYQDVIDSLTGECGLGLWDFEMDLAEWTLAKQLCNVLKVRVTANPRFSLITLTT